VRKGKSKRLETDKYPSASRSGKESRGDCEKSKVKKKRRLEKAVKKSFSWHFFKMSIPVNSLYSLTWGDYGTSLVSAVQLLRCHGDLVDVTLAAEGRSFEAHKIVLCAASPYLLNLLKVSTAIFFFLHIQLDICFFTNTRSVA
jgi:hypothetical protein